MQSDFSQLFRSDRVAPLHFRVRDDACFIHDIEFLSSYLHDARLSVDAITNRGKKFSVVVQRDCWELGYTEHARSLELHIAKSRLCIAPVSGIRWEIREPKVFEQELWIESIYPGPAHWEISGASELIISRPHAGWKLCVSIAADFPDIRLDDLESPYLYSGRKAKK